MDWQDTEKKLRSTLSVKRMVHTQGVVLAAEQLALKYGGNMEEAKLAALLHDCARELEACQLLALAEGLGVQLTRQERIIPDILHGQVGARIAARDYHITNPRILQAIERHTVGHPAMSLLDKIIFLADMIEPGRIFPGVDSLRELAQEDLNRAVLAGFDSTITYVVANHGYLHPVAIDARNALWVEIYGPQ